MEAINEQRLKIKGLKIKGLMNVGDSCYLNAAIQVLLPFLRFSFDPERLALIEFLACGNYNPTKLLGDHFPLLAPGDLEAYLTLEDLKLSREVVAPGEDVAPKPRAQTRKAKNSTQQPTLKAVKSLVPEQVQFPLYYLLSSVIKIMLEGTTAPPFKLLRALQFKLKSLQPTIHDNALTEDASDIFFRLIECKNYLMLPTHDVKAQIEQALSVVERDLDIDVLRGRLSVLLVQDSISPEFRLWLGQNLDSDNFGRKFVK
jgi:hypothetical protein